MLGKPLTDVLVQGFYMSGDRNTIATALQIAPKLGVLILSSPGGETRAAELKDLYTKVAGARRVEVCTVPQGNHPTGLDAAKAAYDDVSQHCRDRKKNARPTWINTYVHPDVLIQPATHGTKEIAANFQQGRTANTQRKIRELWRLPSGGSDDILGKVAQWLAKKGFQKNRAYVFLFVKQGERQKNLRNPKLLGAPDRTAEKAHHFTSILTWRILVDRISAETNVIPVAMGEPVGLRTTPTLVEFWEDEEWKAIFQNVQGIDKRSAQLGMWCYLAETFPGLSIIGMRSGMLEVPALLGIRTMYLEEKHNDQANRMANWLERDGSKGKDGVPGFTRLEVNRPPGIAQQIYWNSQALNGKDTSKPYQHAKEQGAHLENLNSSHSLRQQDVVKAVFNRSMLARVLVPAEKFQLETSEFEAILKWVKQTPQPNGATTNIHGAVPGHLAKRDDALQSVFAKKQEQKWTEYFASKEYLATLPQLKLK